MATAAINIGPKRVAFTTYCPDDALGLMASSFVCEKVKEALDNTTEETLRQWIREKYDDADELFAMLDEGYELPKLDTFTIDPRNAKQEMKCVAFLQREMMEQCGR